MPIELTCGISLRETSFSANTVLARHHHAAASFSYVIAGGYTESIGRRQFACEQGDLLYKPASIEHKNRISSSALRALFIETAWCANEEGAPAMQPNSRRLSSARGGVIIRHLLAELAGQLPDRSLVIEGLVCELVHEAERKQRNAGTQRWLSRAHQFLVEHHSINVTLSLVARYVGVHPVHLAQAFRIRYGRTVGDCLREVRLTGAAMALRTKRLPISDIAHAAGFADQSHLTRLFHGRFGVTPAVYRRSFQ